MIQSGRDFRRSLIQPSAVIRPSCSVFLCNWVLGISGWRLHIPSGWPPPGGRKKLLNVTSEHQFSELMLAASCPLLHCRVPGFILSALEGYKIPLNRFSRGWISPAPSSSTHRKNAPALNNPGGPLLSALEFGSFLYWGPKKWMDYKGVRFQIFLPEINFFCHRAIHYFPVLCSQH